MRHVRRALAIGAIVLWVAALGGGIAAPWIPAIDQLDAVHRTVIGMAIAVTVLWVADTARGRRDGRDTTYQAGYIAGRADEREARLSEQRTRTVQIDDIEATVVGGENRPLSGDTIRVIQQIREGMRS